MTEASRIEDQLRRSLEGEAWHGPALMELLKDVAAETAAAPSLADAHTIWELVLHVKAWQDSAHRSLRGESGRVSDEENFPSVADASETSWRGAVQSMVDSNRELREAVMKLEDEALEQPVPGRDFPLYLLLHGVVQHNLYHAGQIALLKKGR